MQTKVVAVSLFLLLIIGLTSFSSIQSLSDPPTPYWGSSKIWSILVTETFNGTVFDFNYYYDWNNKLERYEYGRGQIEGMCRASGFGQWEGALCNSVYTPDGWWYVEFPEHNYCCKCINTYGPIRYDWLQSNSTYQGKSTYNGTVTDYWLKQGNMGPNYMHVSATPAQLPIVFRENFSGGNYKQWDFHLNTYSTAAINPQKFAKPANCDTRCGGQCPSINPHSSMSQIFNSLKKEE